MEQVPRIVYATATLHAEECKCDDAAKDLSTEFLDSKNGLLGAQELMPSKGEDACHADMLSSFDLNTTQGQRCAAKLHSSSGGPAGAFLTAIPGGRMTLCNDMLFVSVWHRLRWAPRCANAVQELLPKQICEDVAKITSIHHDNLANASRVDVSACSCCQPAAEPRYRSQQSHPLHRTHRTGLHMPDGGLLHQSCGIRSDP